mmetsp:Transcript_50825/g.95059  ORF Transcript_50825/g.95059 Transcript_50825/m.95059 type:complete len:307 (+) Transcript_50825:341-1261(+)
MCRLAPAILLVEGVGTGDGAETRQGLLNCLLFRRTCFLAFLQLLLLLAHILPAGFVLGRRSKIWNSTTLPIIKDDTCRGVDVGFASFHQLAHLLPQNSQELLTVLPGGVRRQAVSLQQVRLFHSLQHLVDVVRRGFQPLRPHHAFQDLGAVRSEVTLRGRHNAGAIQHVDLLCEGDVLPHACLTRNRCRFADFFPLQRVDDGRLAHVRVADHPDSHVFFLLEQVAKLTQQVQQGVLAEGVGDRRVERQGREIPHQLLDPPPGDPSRDQVHFVHKQHDVLVCSVLPQLSLQLQAAGAHGIPCVEHED